MQLRASRVRSSNPAMRINCTVDQLCGSTCHVQLSQMQGFSMSLVCCRNSHQGIERINQQFQVYWNDLFHTLLNVSLPMASAALLL